MKKIAIFVFLISISSFLLAQAYNDYYGAGHDRGVKVTASHVENVFVAENTVNGSGMDANKQEAARFLAQATFGGGMDEIEALAIDLDYENWIEEQFQLEPTFLLEKLWEINTQDSLLFIAERVDTTEEFFGPYTIHFNYAWWDNNIKEDDQLRHRIAYALSQILVISGFSEAGEYGDGLTSYYDLLLEHAFGNYEDLLLDVSLDPNMGMYLTHLNNYKSDPLAGTVPDENFAREIMQLFSIGLYELNNDGTRKTDAQGNWIPTYDNNDIRELAKVFTGLQGGDWSRQAIAYGVDVNEPVPFGAEYPAINRSTPMIMEESQHESGPKTIIGDFTIPSGQTGMEDITQAVRHIFQHPNVGPFIAFRLIQQLITSNPTPAYVNRVANAFNDNGLGERGDLKAVIKAILLDEEARSCSAREQAHHGKLIEPVLRNTMIMHALPTISETGNYWNNGLDYFQSTAQSVLAAPSVFNFYPPDHQPSGEIGDEGLFGPEFRIHNAQTAIGYINQSYKWTEWRILFWDFRESTKDVIIDYSGLSILAGDPETLINQLDLSLTRGRMSLETRKIIKEAINKIPDQWDGYRLERAKLAVYLTMISPDFVVLK